MTVWTNEIKDLEKLYDSFKGNLPNLEKELEQLIRTQDVNVIMLYSRRCLEVIIAELCENELKRPRKTEPLKGIIDKLRSEEKAPSHIITSMDHLNSLSSYGTHPKDFDPEQVKPVLNNLTTIIKWYLKYKDSKVISKTRAEEKKLERIHSVSLLKPVQTQKQRKKSVITVSGVLISAIIIVLVLNFFNVFTKDRFKNIKNSSGRISIAVMPFQNMTNDTLWTFWQDGIQDNLITSLSTAKELLVRQRETVTNLLQSKGLINYASITPSVASTLSQKLDADVVISGSITKAGSILRLNAQLIDAKTKEILKPFQIDGTAIQDSMFKIIDTLSKKVKNFLIISSLKKELNPEAQVLASTNSPEAYRYALEGYKAFAKFNWSAAIKSFSNSLATDSNYLFIALLMANAYSNQGKYDQAKELFKKVYKKRDQFPENFKIWIDYYHAYWFEMPFEVIKYAKQLLEFDDQSPTTYWLIGDQYTKSHQYVKAIPEYKKTLEIYNKWGVKPFWVASYTALGYCYHKTGQYKEEKKLYEKAEQDFPDDAVLIKRQSILALTEGDTFTANRCIKKYKSHLNENSAANATIENEIGGIYSEGGNLDKAEEAYRKSISFSPKNPYWKYSLAYFLIDKERNINEGLVLVDTLLKIRPDDFNYLHAKGWGLYKQGKYKEALEILQKSWDLRPTSIFSMQIYYHLEEAKNAVAERK